MFEFVATDSKSWSELQTLSCFSSLCYKQGFLVKYSFSHITVKHKGKYEAKKRGAVRYSGREFQHFQLLFHYIHLQTKNIVDADSRILSARSCGPSLPHKVRAYLYGASTVLLVTWQFSASKACRQERCSVQSINERKHNFLRHTHKPTDVHTERFWTRLNQWKCHKNKVKPTPEIII